MLLVERGLAESRAKAQALIYAGQVRVDEQVVLKPSLQLRSDAQISIAALLRFVSRGGEKLDHALDRFAISVKDKICLDVGASTGGFTDCLLQRGAQKVYAVDVGAGQLHWKLMNDKRVVAINKKNARYLESGEFADKPQVAVVDVSFISLTKVLPAVISILVSGGIIVALVKPQFEAERGENKGGVVRSAEVHAHVVEKIRQFGVQEMGLEFKGECESPLKGPAGNVEFFIFWVKP